MTYKSPETETHPSYGVICISRQSGDRSLFQSAMRHQYTISIEISHAELVHRMDGQDGQYPKQEIVEVLMSEAQFARAITSMNMGCGSPCTIHHIGRKSVPEPPIINIRDPHIREINEAVDERFQQARQVLEKLEKMRDDKARPTLKELDSLTDNLRQSLDYFKVNFQFYIDTFHEKMEHIVADAKTEVEAHTQAVIAKVGMKAIEAQFPKLTDQSHENNHEEGNH